LPEVDEATQHRFDEGHKVGELAKSLFPDGIELKEQLNHLENDKESRELLKKRKPLFEAGFIHKDGKCYARADILVPSDKNKKEWDIYEVKSATSVKEEYPWDVAFQKYCYESTGLKINKCFVMHINNQYIRQGKINAGEFFVKADITDEVEELIKDVPANVKLLFKIISLKECPEFKKGEEYHEDELGVHANDQFWKEHPECDILDLYYGGKRAIELFNSGVLTIKDMCEEHYDKLNEKQKIQHKCSKSGKHYCDMEELNSFINELKYPLYFLDFETYGTAIPLYDGLKPYQQIPFQYSLHVIKKKGAKPKHHSFIANGSEDPRPEFIKSLKKNLGTKGTIITYNQSFEQGRLKEVGEYYPLYLKWVDSVIKRMVDLLVPFRNFAYYHPEQKGSASLKSVLPVLTGKSYEGYEIANGGDASTAYYFITHGSIDGKKATPEQIKKVREDLEKYCGLDTEGMIWILDKLIELSVNSK
jgi:hypothetical protein